MLKKGILSTLLFAFTYLSAQQKPVQIAFLSDVHFQDLYGNFSDHDFKGIVNPKTGKATILRTMDAQLHSTRIFNENYFAFLKVLDDIATKGIKIVAMPGDFSDDGQAYNIRGLRQILRTYHEKYGISFYMTTGNHDPVGPFYQDAGKDDFLGDDGNALGIYSNKNLSKNKRNIITKDIAESGYLGILNELRDFGFYPQKENLYWSTPFVNYSYSSYSYDHAIKYANYRNRMYEVSKGFSVPDLSYVVEPVNGVWMMAIDGNTYIPKDVNKSSDDPGNYNGASIGYNNVVTHKKHLIQWVKKIAAEAERNGKTLIAFTHYPMIDFNDGATDEIKKLLGEKKWQLERVPEEEVAKDFLDAGLQIHFAGHMHINDTGIRKIGDKMLVNIQVPSLAAYLPGYKVLTIHSQDVLEVRTEVLHEVPRFDELFPLYEKEYKAVEKAPGKRLWNKEILNTKSYRDFMSFHLKELVRLRMIPDDWPKDFIEKGGSLSGKELLLLSEGSESPLTKSINIDSFQKWSLEDLIFDLYKFQSADELARKDISTERLAQYQVLIKSFGQNQSKDSFILKLKSVFRILSLLSSGDPADHFEIDLKKQSVKKL